MSDTKPPPVTVPETPAQAEERARLSNPVGDRMIALFRSLAGEFGVASDRRASARRSDDEQ